MYLSILLLGSLARWKCGQRKRFLDSMAKVGSVKELFEFLLPKSLRNGCPSWPPDAFALVSSALSQSGAYVRVVDILNNDGDDWPRKARDVGQRWSAVLIQKLRRSPSQVIEVEGIRSAARQASLPPDVKRWWEVICLSAHTQLSAIWDNDELCRAMLQICCAADEAAAGMGLCIVRRPDGQPETEINDTLTLVAATVLSDCPTGEANTLCLNVSRDKVLVLPKQHTPQRGMTLRSITHHLALCTTTEVEVTWLPPPDIAPGIPLESLFNLLILPWPTKLSIGDFRLHKDSDGRHKLPERYRYFEFSHVLDKGQFVSDMRRAIAVARQYADQLHCVVFPELALTYDVYVEAERVAWEEKIALVAGVSLAEGNLECGGATNASFFQPAGLFRKNHDSGWSQAEALEYMETFLKWQRKHHRWCLDRPQILQYGLGSVLPATRDCWEFTEIGKRELHFVSLTSWLTCCVLVCEDLARQDPMSDVIRAVGPNLVISLLMDGPQLGHRWSSRYALVLAEDPGCSVMTLTSLGMAGLSPPPPGKPKRSRLVGLWRDVTRTDPVELELPPDCDAGLLSLVCQSREEFTADGRTDDGLARCPVFGGFRALPISGP